MERCSIWLPLVSLLATLLLAGGVELTFELDDNAKECFYQEIEKNVSSTLEFQVRGPSPPPPLSPGDTRVSFTSDTSTNESRVSASSPARGRRFGCTLVHSLHSSRIRIRIFLNHGEQEEGKKGNATVTRTRQTWRKISFSFLSE